MGNDDEKKLRQWLREFGCENACEVLIDAGFDSLAMLSSLDDEELQMLEICLKDLPVLKQRRILKKAEGLAESDIATAEPAWPSGPARTAVFDHDGLPEPVSQIRCRSPVSKKSIDVVPVVSMSGVRPAAMMSIVPVAHDADDTSDESDDKKLMIRIVPDSTTTTAASSRSPSRTSKDASASTIPGVQHPSLRVNNFLTDDSQGKHARVSAAKASPGRIDDVHPLHQIAMLGGFLCLNSGWVNGVGFRSFDGGVTHITGTSTKVGLKLATWQLRYFLRSAAKCFVFTFGAVISGGYLGRNRLFRGGPRYAHLLLLVSAAMFAAFVAERSQENFLGSLLLTMGSGVMNALTSIYSGAVVKTATVTSYVTDIGAEIGMVLFHKDFKYCWKLKLLSTFFLAYVAGGFLGASCFDPEFIRGSDFARAEAQALLVPATSTLALALAWLLALRVTEPDPRGYGLFAEVSQTPAGLEDSGIVAINRSSSLYARGAAAA